MKYCSSNPKLTFCQVLVTVQTTGPVFISSFEMKLAELGENNFVLCGSLIIIIDKSDFYYIVQRHLATCFTTSIHPKALKIRKFEITIVTSVVVGPIEISDRNICVLLSKSHSILRQSFTVLYTYFVQKCFVNM